MRTTLTLDEDVAAAVAQLQRERGVGVSAAVNELVRRGLLREPASKPFVQRTSRMGVRIDVTNVAEALDLLDGPSAR
jgi:Arc/MetJ family transcription regulator